MTKRNNGPDCLEAALGRLLLFGGVVVLARSFHARQGAFGLLCGYELDQVGDEQLTWYRKIEGESIDDILATVAVA